ncbi:MAG: GatB/YqeY domain-containing protein [Calditrichaeota bacterium]|nr:MAG: GatB/YqeY domain-containing protein [Calditrichota bacterium]
MILFDRLTEEMKQAMKSREQEKVAIIRLLRGYIKNESIDKRRDLSEEEEIAVLNSAAKKRKESIQAFREGNREDLAQKEEYELKVINSYLPQPLTHAEILAIIDAAIAQVGAKTLNDLGKVMPLVMQQVKGRADGKEINALVRSRLAV